MKKSLLALAALAALSLVFVSCGGGNDPDTPESPVIDKPDTPDTPEEGGNDGILFTWNDFAVQGSIAYSAIGITDENKDDYKIVIKGTVVDSAKVNWGYGALVDPATANWDAIVSLDAKADGVQEIDIATLYAVNSEKIQFNIWDTSYYTVTSVTIEKK